MLFGLKSEGLKELKAEFAKSTPEILAREIGISYPTLKKIWSGGAMYPSTMAKIIKHFGWSRDDWGTKIVER